MKRKLVVRVLIMVIAVSMFAALLSGCTKDELKLFSALLNSQPVYSYESVASVEYTLDIVPTASSRPSYYSDSTETVYRVLGALYEGAGYDMSVKSTSDKEYSNVKQEVIVTPRLFGGRLENLTTGLWADIDGSDNSKSNLYVLMPKLLSSISKETAGKDYLTMNLGKVYDLLSAEAGFDMSKMPDNAELAELALEVAKPIMDAIVKAALQLKPDELYISGSRPYTDSNWQKGVIYTLRISDSGLKKLVRSAVNDIEKEVVKEVLDAAIDGTIAIIASYADVSEEYQDMLEQLIGAKEYLDKGFDFAYDLAIMVANEYLDKLEGVRVLGPKGFTFDIGVDSNGFVSLWDGVIDVSLDFAGFEKRVLESSYPSDIKRIDFTIKIFYEMTRINKVVYVEMPEVTSANSVSVERLIEASMAADSYWENYYSSYMPYDEDYYSGYLPYEEDYAPCDEEGGVSNYSWSNVAFRPVW